MNLPPSCDSSILRLREIVSVFEGCLQVVSKRIRRDDLPLRAGFDQRSPAFPSILGAERGHRYIVLQSLSGPRGIIEVEAMPGFWPYLSFGCHFLVSVITLAHVIQKHFVHAFINAFIHKSISKL